MTDMFLYQYLISYIIKITRVINLLIRIQYCHGDAIFLVEPNKSINLINSNFGSFAATTDI